MISQTTLDRLYGQHSQRKQPTEPVAKIFTAGGWQDVTSLTGVELGHFTAKASGSRGYVASPGVLAYVLRR
jgi:hypothetical protein